jgi:hypothetical protein
MKKKQFSGVILESKTPFGGRRKKKLGFKKRGQLLRMITCDLLKSTYSICSLS